MIDLPPRRVALVGALLLTAACAGSKSRDTLYQVSTIDALLDGVYDGPVTVGELARHGDFGIGCYNALDGEMVVADGRFYQVRANGEVLRADKDARSPFACVTWFDADRRVDLDEVKNLEDLEAKIDELLPTKNIFYAIRVPGRFQYVKTRSVPRQRKPYPPLVEVVKRQPVFEFQVIDGALVGFRCPAYVKGINVPEYHLHFIADDETAGGHLLDVRFEGLTVEIDETNEFRMFLPPGEAFYGTDLARERADELKKVER